MTIKVTWMLCEQWLSHDSNMTKTAAVVLFPGCAVPSHTVWEQGYHWTGACKNCFRLPQWALGWTNAGQVFHLLEGIIRWPYRVHFSHCDGCDGLVTNGCRLRERANHKVLQVNYQNSIEGNECCHGNHSHRLTLGLCVDFQMILKLVTYSFPAAKKT